jgi:hypothetical protein
MISKTIKVKWLNALRSNKYQKTTGYLRKGKAYDALGILCKVTGNENNRLMNVTYPRRAKNGRVLEFMGLSPNVQATIRSLNNEQEGFSAVIRYISRNIKVKN